MSQSEGVESGNLTRALERFSEALGERYVVTSACELRRYETATFATDCTVPAVLRPGSAVEVQACLRIANEFRVPVYPISTGLNTGYGSAVPTAPDCVVLELKRLNGIRDYDPELGVVTIEPGVTQRQLYEYLRSHDAPFWLDVTGSYPQHSVIGNIAERGFGHTAYADHYANVGAMQIVLPSGDLIGTGFAQFPDAAAAGYYRWGVGPHYDGLFTQSSLGIIVEASIWLMPAPETMCFFACRIERDDQLGELVDRLRPLRLDGTIRSAMHIGNDYKIVSAAGPYPWDRAGGRTPLPPDVLEHEVRTRDCGAWNVSGALYGTKVQVRDAKRRIRRSLRGLAERLVFIDERMLGIAHKLAKPVATITGIDLPGVLRVLEPVHGMTRGVPSDAMIPTNYWRKRRYPESAEGLCPEQDGCGVMWLGPVAPTSGAHAMAIWKIVRKTMLSHGFEPAVTLTLLTERAMDCVVNLSYDRDIDGEDTRAMACHDEMLDALIRAGYFPYRLGLHNMAKLPARGEESQRFGRRLKTALDPNGILAPGRYPF